MVFGEVLKKLRTERGMSQQNLADLLGVKRPTVTNYELGTSFPAFHQLLDIVRLFDVSSDYLLGLQPSNTRVEENVEATPAFQNKKYISSVAEPEPLLRPQILVATQDTSGNLTVPIVNRKAAASYLSGYQTQEYFEELDALTVPAYMLRGGQGLIIQATNDSMEDTIFEGDMLLCRYMEAAQWDEIPDFSVCVIVSESRGIQVKRVKARFQREGFIRCKSDNRTYRSFNLFAADILQIWQVSLLLTTNMPNRADTLYRKIDHLEEGHDDMRELYEQMRQELKELKGNFLQQLQEQKGVGKEKQG
jgi:transcriptional regulator with XRE-family HTH domain